MTSSRTCVRNSVSTRPGSISVTRRPVPTLSWRSASANTPTPNFVRL